MKIQSPLGNIRRELERLEKLPTTPQTKKKITALRAKIAKLQGR